MGKQVGIFASISDMENLLLHIEMLGVVLLDKHGKEIGRKETIDGFDAWMRGDYISGFSKVYLTKSHLLRIFSETKNGEMQFDEFRSDVIELSACTPSEKQIVDTSDIDEKFRVGGCIIISPERAEEYWELMAERTKKPRYIPNPNYVKNGYEYGRVYYQTSYFDDTHDCMMSKSPELDSLYNSIKRYIYRMYKKGKDKFFCIAPNAYEKYLRGEFVPCSGNNRIFF